MRVLTSLALAIALLVANIAIAQDAQVERVQFPAGQSGTAINASLTGYESVHYLLGARAGQRMVVEMSASNPATYYNIFAPGDRPGASEAMHIAATNGLRYEGVLPSNGDYLIQVFINRNAARRNESTNYALNVSIGGSATVPDYADGLAGGPDYWEVTGVSQSLNIRSGPSTNSRVLIGLLRGTVVRNLGCRMNEGRRWCQVSQIEGGVTGWAAGQYLREAAAPSAVAPPPATSGNNSGANASVPLDMMPTWCRNEAAVQFNINASDIAATVAQRQGSTYRVKAAWPGSNPTDYFTCTFDASGSILSITPE